MPVIRVEVPAGTPTGTGRVAADAVGAPVSDHGGQPVDGAGQPFHEIERQGQQPVAYPFGASAAADLGIDRLQRRRVRMEADGEGYAFLEDELMQGLQGTRATGLHLDRDDATAFRNSVNVIGPRFRYSMRPTGMENVWSESMNSISDPAATTGRCGISSKKYRYEYPHVGGILKRIAEDYDSDAVREDTEANLQRRFPNW